MRIEFFAARKPAFFRACLCALAFLAGIPLNADEPRPPPTLMWEAVEYAYCYEITLETYDEETSSYVPALTVQTEDTSLALPLPEGLYRYKIAVLNVLDKVDVSSDWEPLVIRKAYQPQITLVKPKKIYLDETPRPSLSFTVQNFLDDSEVFLIDAKQTGQDFAPEGIAFDGKKITFALDSPAPGIYQAQVTNPGGLTASSKQFVIYQYKPWNIDIAFSPPFVTLVQPLPGTAFFDAYGAQPTILASRLRFTVFPIKVSETRFFGFEILPVWFFKLNNDGSAISGFNAVTAHINLVFHQSFLQKKIALTVRAGAGAAWFAARFYHRYEPSETLTPDDSLVPSVMLGAAAAFFLFDRKTFVEISVDLAIGANLTTLSPSVGIGKRF